MRRPNSALFATLLALAGPASLAAQSYQVARITTPLGEIRFLLDDRTPRHKAAFMRFAAAGYFDTLTFNRVIPHFVAQGGCPDVPEGFSKYPDLLQPELNDGLKHTYGAVGAGHDGNAQSIDPGCQFYIVVNQDGLKRLDGKFTVFGQVFQGMDVAERIVHLPRDSTDQPHRPMTLKVEVITMTADELRRAGARVP